MTLRKASADTDSEVADPAALSSRLRAVRLQNGLEQAQLGVVASTPATSISLFESGKRKPSIDTLARLADALGVSVDYLLGRTSNPQSHLGGAEYNDAMEEYERTLGGIESSLQNFRRRKGADSNQLGVQRTGDRTSVTG